MRDDSDRDTDEPDHDPAPRTSPRFRLALLVSLLVLLVVAIGAAAYLAATRAESHLGLGGKQEELQLEREAVMSQAEQFMLRVNTYGPDMLEGSEMPEYRSLVEEVVTPKFAESFKEGASLAEQTVVQTGVQRTATVNGTGVTVLDSDSATSLVAGFITNAFPDPDNEDEMVPQAPQPFRVEVQLVKIDGEWLVDDFGPVTNAETQESAP